MPALPQQPLMVSADTALHAAAASVMTSRMLSVRGEYVSPASMAARSSLRRRDIRRLR